MGWLRVTAGGRRRRGWQHGVLLSGRVIPVCDLGWHSLGETVRGRRSSGLKSAAVGWALGLADSGNWPSASDWFWNTNARVAWAPGPRVRVLSQPGPLHYTIQLGPEALGRGECGGKRQVCSDCPQAPEHPHRQGGKAWLCSSPFPA